MFQIVTFYRFIQLKDLETKRDRLKASMLELGIKGTVILAPEGFNSSLCGWAEDVEPFLAGAEATLGSAFEYKSSFHEAMPFRRVDVKIKPEIVTLKKTVDMSLGDGTHVDAAKWNELISDSKTLVFDTRNHYEVKNGSFSGALNPKTAKFSELPKFVKENFDPEKHKHIAMYCTGGIRCEKFAPYLRSQGFENVYQLKGGILKYLETIPKKDSLWNGECFVFDDRRTVDDELRKGSQPDYSLTPIDEAGE